MDKLWNIVNMHNIIGNFHFNKKHVRLSEIGIIF
jgi:hypothetical protein